MLLLSKKAEGWEDSAQQRLAAAEAPQAGHAGSARDAAGPAIVRITPKVDTLAQATGGVRYGEGIGNDTLISGHCGVHRSAEVDKGRHVPR